MARQRPLPKRPARSRVQTCISGELHERVDLYCTHYGLSEARFFEIAAREKIDGVGEAKSIVRELKKLSEQIAIMSEHDHQYFLTWLENTQLFSPGEVEQARPQMQAMYQRFMRRLEANLSGGRTFLGAAHERLSAPKQEPSGALPKRTGANNSSPTGGSQPASLSRTQPPNITAPTRAVVDPSSAARPPAHL